MPQTPNKLGKVIICGRNLIEQDDILDIIINYQKDDTYGTKTSSFSNFENR